jgi:hypothetical protein
VFKLDIYIIVFTISWKTPLKHFLIPDLTIFILQQFNFLICYLDGEFFIHSTFNRIDGTSITITITIFSTYLIPIFPCCFCVPSLLCFNFLIAISNRLICKLVFMESGRSLIRRGPSGTTRKYRNISLGWTDRTAVLSLSRPYNTGYRVKYPVFARFLTPRGAQTSLIY